jgi:hypothetical protein
MDMESISSYEECRISLTSIQKYNEITKHIERQTSNRDIKAVSMHKGR